MQICLISTEIFHWGTYGGFGALTKMIGREMVKKGVNVSVLVPQKSKRQNKLEFLEGMTVISISAKPIFGYRSLPLECLLNGSSFKLGTTDIFHSEEPSVISVLAMRSNRDSKHLITFQDPRTLADNRKVWALDPRFNSYKFRTMLMVDYGINDFFIKKAIQRADALFCQAKYTVPKVITMYKLQTQPLFLPNPVEVPTRALRKADEPTVCFVARWDPVKRPKIFFKLAKMFPNVKFIALGKAHNKERDQCLREKYRCVPNLLMTGFVSEEEKSQILEKSWILVNTSIRECLPISFLEAAAHECAILSSENPDNFAEDFGYHVTDGNYASGLRYLLEDDRWMERGKKAYRYVKRVHEVKNVVNQHILIYKKLLDGC